jgi:hypothetical protein
MGVKGKYRKPRRSESARATISLVVYLRRTDPFVAVRLLMGGVAELPPIPCVDLISPFYEINPLLTRAAPGRQGV